ERRQEGNDPLALHLRRSVEDVGKRQVTPSQRRARASGKNLLRELALDAAPCRFGTRRNEAFARSELWRSSKDLPARTVPEGAASFSEQLTDPWFSRPHTHVCSSGGSDASPQTRGIVRRGC